jgi:hypothetical protein
MRKRNGVLAIAFGLLLSAVPALAHHSFSSEFDHNKRVTVKGVVTRIEWANPHVYVYMNVTDQNGKVTPWYFESYPPPVLRNAGLTKELLKKQVELGKGGAITAEGYRAKDGSNFFWVYKMDFSDGRSLVFSRDFDPNSKP